MRNRLYLFIILSLLLASCGSNLRKEYFSDGTLQREFETDAAGVPNGQYWEYYENGALRIECNYLHGKRDGSYKQYYQDGNLSIVGTFKADSIIDTYTTFYPNKQVKKRVIYTSGTRNGTIQEYYENGQLKIAGKLSGGVQDGNIITYFPNGQIETIDNYTNGIQHGNYQTFFRTGQLKLEAEINQGKTVYYLQYDSSGSVVDEFHEVTISPSPLSMNQGEVAHFDINVTGPPAPGSYYRLLLTNSNLPKELDEQNQTFRLLKIGTANKYSYIYSYESRQDLQIISTGPIAKNKVIEASDTTGHFTVDITPDTTGSYILLGVVNTISAVSANGVEYINKTYPFVIKFVVH
jgi:antitoxin component YwqK of YwqJK toxin-antitoxin module